MDFVQIRALFVLGYCDNLKNMSEIETGPLLNNVFWLFKRLALS